MMGIDNPLHIAFLLVVLLLVFGAKRLPEMGRSLGEGLRGFKSSINGDGASPVEIAVPAAAPVAVPAVAPVTVPAPVPTATPDRTSHLHTAGSAGETAEPVGQPR